MTQCTCHCFLDVVGHFTDNPVSFKSLFASLHLSHEKCMRCLVKCLKICLQCATKSEASMKHKAWNTRNSSACHPPFFNLAIGFQRNECSCASRSILFGPIRTKLCHGYFGFSVFLYFPIHDYYVTETLSLENCLGPQALIFREMPMSYRDTTFLDGNCT